MDKLTFTETIVLVIMLNFYVLISKTKQTLFLWLGVLNAENDTQQNVLYGLANWMISNISVVRYIMTIIIAVMGNGNNNEQISLGGQG